MQGRGIMMGAAVAVGMVWQSPAISQDLAVIPDGCTAFLTVQQRGCQVRHLYRCADYPAGDLTRLLYDAEGPLSVSTTDAETQWIVYRSMRTDFQRYLRPDAADLMSLTVLLEEQFDSFDFETADQNGAVSRWIGYDSLTGETEVIDGVELLVTSFENTRINEDGEVAWEARGTEYIHPGWRTYFGGRVESSSFGERFYHDHRPVDFIYPGETGFLSAVPIHDCDMPQTSKSGSEG